MGTTLQRMAMRSVRTANTSNVAGAVVRQTSAS